MTLLWIRESPAHWDEGKARLIGRAPPGLFDNAYRCMKLGAPLSSEWWRVEEGGLVVGYGWLEVVWGDAEILLATAPEARGRGVGGFILTRLEDEARARGLGNLYNALRRAYPRAAEIRRWLEKHGFAADETGRYLRAVPGR